MKTGTEALILFYAFFWATALSVTGRYQPFDTPSMCRSKTAFARFCVSLVILNILPILLLMFLYGAVIPDKEGWKPIAAAATSSLSAFGFHRLLHAVVASEVTWRYFYDSKDQVYQVRDRGKGFDQPQSFKAHFIPGLAYIVLPVLFGWLLTLLP